jgi:prepilin-type N-terminal cleavage/methylation domain-containing protein
MRKGFTMMEFIIVIVIIAIAISIIYASFNMTKYKTGDKVILKANGDIGTVMSVLKTESDGFPEYKYSILVENGKNYSITVDRSDIEPLVEIEK